MDPQQVLSILNTLGFPVLAIWAYHRGYVVSPRELRIVLDQYQQLLQRTDRLESEISAEREAMRKELAETRALVISLLMGEKHEHAMDMSREQ
jgi:hypothetical protein